MPLAVWKKAARKIWKYYRITFWIEYEKIAIDKPKAGKVIWYTWLSIQYQGLEDVKSYIKRLKTI